MFKDYHAALALLLGLSLFAHYSGNGFYLDIATRLTILAIAAVSLNLILGFGGMISFGHAAYLGLGAYAVGIPAYYEIYSGLVQIPLAHVQNLHRCLQVYRMVELQAGSLFLVLFLCLVKTRMLCCLYKHPH